MVSYLVLCGLLLTVWRGKKVGGYLKAGKDAGKQPGSVVDSIKKARRGLEACLAILQGDKEMAREHFGEIKREKFALALLRLHLGDDEELAIIATREAAVVVGNESANEFDVCGDNPKID